MRRREDGERGTSKSTSSERVESVEGVMADRRISKRLKGKVMSTYTSMPVRIGTDRTTTTKAASVRKQLFKSNRADRRRMVELREETGVRGAQRDW